MTYIHIDVNALFEQHYTFLEKELLPLIVNHAAAGQHDPDMLVLTCICALANMLDEATPIGAQVIAAAVLAVCGEGPTAGQKETIQ